MTSRNRSSDPELAVTVTKASELERAEQDLYEAVTSGNARAEAIAVRRYGLAVRAEIKAIKEQQRQVLLARDAWLMPYRSSSN